MIGFFPGFKMPYHAVNAIASRVWRKCGLESVMTTANGFMIFRFNTEAEMHAVLEKGPWMFGGKNIILQQWHPRFQFDKSKISTLPVWIRLHGLPFPLWSKQGLSLAASMVGRPLSCDESTYTCTRLEYARLCVEIDAALPFVQSFEIDCPLSADPITVTVDYEWKPSRCEKCKFFGHSCPAPSVSPVAAPAPPPQTIPVPISFPTQPNTANIPDSIPSPQPSPKTNLAIPSTVAPPSPTPTPQPHHHTLSNPAPAPAPPSPPAMETCDSSNASGNECPELEPHHITDLNTNTCLESKMDSLRTISESSSATLEVSGATSPAFVPPNFFHSPSPSPKTVRKKKGGKKKKEAKGH
jgi:hypothetical protein